MVAIESAVKTNPTPRNMFLNENPTELPPDTRPDAKAIITTYANTKYEIVLATVARTRLTDVFI